MVQGDSSHVTIEVQQGAQLGVTTQGPNRIYKNTTTTTTARSAATTTRSTTENNNNGDTLSPLLTCRTHLKATVAQDACLVLAPDPTVLFAQSRYDQLVEIHLESGSSSSIIAIDWFAAGRIQNGEEWNFESFETTTQVYRYSRQVLVDHIRLTKDTNTNNFWGTKALCSIVLAGPQSRPVVENLKAWSSQLASRLTSVRNLDEKKRVFHLHRWEIQSWSVSRPLNQICMWHRLLPSPMKTFIAFCRILFLLYSLVCPFTRIALLPRSRY